MPRYYALDTSVKLCVWDPKPTSSSSHKKGYGPLGITSAKSANDELAFKDHSMAVKHNVTPSAEKKKEKSGPAMGYVVDDLKEEYFEGHEGVEFLGQDMPFYLIKAGKELFASSQPANNGTCTSSRDFVELHPPTTSSRSPANPVEPLPASTGEEDADTGLSNIPCLFSAPDDVSQKEGNAAEELVAGQYSMTGSNSLNTAGIKSIVTAKPITLVVGLSQKSFMPSLFSNQKQELCVTIFYNGELTHSRIIRATTFASTRGPVGDEKYQYYSGRRINSLLESPWVVLPHKSTSDSSIQDGQTPSMGFEEKWNKINQMLLAEADEWGRYGEYRSPVGNYLEELSKRAAPESTKNLKDGEGCRTGFIDVIITLGRSVSTNCSGLREPRRKLHEDSCGNKRMWVVAPEELRQAKKAKIIADFYYETSRRNAINGLDTCTVENRRLDDTRTAQKPPLSLTSKPSAAREPILLSAAAICASEQQNQEPPGTAQSHIGGDHATAITKMLHSALSHRSAIQLRGSSSPITGSGTKSFGMPSTPAREHPSKPRQIPQKRYRGADSEAASGSLPKRQKPDNPLEFLHFDSEKPASLSTRSRRAADHSTLPTSGSIRGQKFVKGTQRFRKTNKDDRQNKIPVTQVQLESRKHVSFEREGDSLRTQAHNLESSQFESSVSPGPQEWRGASKSKLRDIQQIRCQNSQESPAITPVIDQNRDSQRVPAESAVVTHSSVVPLRQCPASGHEHSVHESHMRTVDGPAFKNPFDLSVQDPGVPDGIDSTRDEPKRGSRLRSSARSSLPKSWMSKTEEQSVNLTHGSAIYVPPQQHPNTAVTKRKVTRIVFMLRGKVRSAFVTRESFETLGIPGTVAGEVGSIGGKTILFPPVVHPPLSKRRLKESGFCRRPSSAGPIASVKTENVDISLNAQTRAKRDSVSSRELKNLVKNHEPFMGVNSSFGSLFKNTSSATRSTRNSISNPNASDTKPGPSDLTSTDVKDEPSKVASVTASVKDGILTVRKRLINPTTYMEIPQPKHAEIARILDHNTEKYKLSDDTSNMRASEEHFQRVTRQNVAPANATIVEASFAEVAKELLEAESSKSSEAQREIRSLTTVSPKAIKPSTEKRSSESKAPAESPQLSTVPKGQLLAKIFPYQNSERSPNPTPAGDVKVSVYDTHKLSMQVPIPTRVVELKTSISQSTSKAELTEDTPSPSAGDDTAPSSGLWKPNALCDDSVLTYATGGVWPGVSVDPVSGNVCRIIRAEREGVFRASGVLMGIRFVVGL